MKTKMKTNVTMTTAMATRVGESEQGQGVEMQTCLKPQVCFFYLFFILLMFTLQIYTDTLPLQ